MENLALLKIIISPFITILDKLGILDIIKKISFERGVEIKTKKGINSYIVGSNRVTGAINFIEYKGKQLITVKHENGRLFLTTTILDKDNQIVARIYRNKVTENKDKIFTIERSRNRIALIKKERMEYVEFIIHDDGTLEINGTFYCDGKKVIDATPQGTMLEW